MDNLLRTNSRVQYRRDTINIGPFKLPVWPMAVEQPSLVPPPWKLTGQLYWFSISTPLCVPDGAYAPLEATSVFASEEADKFCGGPFGSAAALIVRYDDSPVGPYDELLLLPGRFETPTGDAHLRITRIYLSTDPPIYNGRMHWGIPKHKARFTFTNLEPDNSNSPLKIEVFPLPLDAKPFFSAIATPASYIPSFPFSTSVNPNFSIVHPPLPNGGPDLPGTEHWILCDWNIKGWAHIVNYLPGGDDNGVPTGEYTDGVGFPKLEPCKWGMHLQNMTMIVPEGKVVDGKKTK